MSEIEINEHNPPPVSCKMFQITEPDLAELESLLPQVMWDRPDLQNTRVKIKWRRIIEIIKDVRWNYGPPLQCYRLEADET